MFLETLLFPKKRILSLKCVTLDEKILTSPAMAKQVRRGLNDLADELNFKIQSCINIGEFEGAQSVLKFHIKRGLRKKKVFRDYERILKTTNCS